MSEREEMFRRFREGTREIYRGIPEHFQCRCGPSLSVKAKPIKMMTTEEKTQYLRAMRPSSEILIAAGSGNKYAREIVRLATNRSPDSGGQRRRLNGTVGVFVSPSPADINGGTDGREETEG